jgi:hypothetical protein
MDVKRAEDVVSRIRSRFLSAKAAVERGNKEAHVRLDKERSERAQLEVLEEEAAGLRRRLEQAESDIELAREERDEVALVLLRAQIQAGQRGLTCDACGHAVLPGYGDVDSVGATAAAKESVQRWTSQVEGATLKLFLVRWRATNLGMRCAAQDDAVAKRRTKVNEAESMSRGSEEVARAARGELEMLSTSLREAEEDLKRRVRVAAAYSAVAPGLAEQQGALSRAHLVPRSNLRFRVNVTLVTGDRFELVGCDEKVRGRFCARMAEGLVKLLADQGDPRSLAEMERRLVLAGLSEQPDGATRVHLYLVEEPGDPEQYVLDLLARLRANLLPVLIPSSNPALTPARQYAAGCADSW